MIIISVVVVSICYYCFYGHLLVVFIVVEVVEPILYHIIFN